MTGEGGDKYLEVGRLLELLGRLDANYRIYPNRVGNLAITDADDNYKGFIDFLLEGSIETSEP